MLSHEMVLNVCEELLGGGAAAFFADAAVMPTLSLISLEVASKSGIGIPEATLFTHGNIFGLRFPFFRKDRGARWPTLVNVCVWQSSNLHAECHYCYLVCFTLIRSLYPSTSSTTSVRTDPSILARYKL